MTGKITGALREQSDWAQNDEHRLGFIKNKPFYDTRKAESLTITFPTPYTETVTDPDSGTIIYKISEQVPTYEDVLRGWIAMDGQKGYFSEPGLVQTSIMADGTKGLLIGGTFGIVSDQSNILTPGIWVRDIEQLNGATLHFPSVTTGELKTIDPKYYRKTFDLNAYVGEETEIGTTVSIAMAIAALADSGGGSCVLSGEDITRFCNEIRNCNTDISVLAPLGNVVYELHPTFVGKEGKTALGFNTVYVSSDPTHSFTIAFALFCLTESLQVYVVIR